MHCLALWGQHLPGQRSYPGEGLGRGNKCPRGCFFWSPAHWGLTISQAVAEDGNLNLVVRELENFQDGGLVGNLPAGGPERGRDLFEVTQL